MWLCLKMWIKESRLHWCGKKIGGRMKKRFFRYRFNPDKIKVSVVRDYNKAFEIFLKGGVDMFGLAKTEFWYDKLPDTHKLVQNGYLSKVTFLIKPLPRLTH